MKLCWDNIENIRLTKNGNFRDIVKCITYYLKICEKCKEEYLSIKKNQIYCSKSCRASDRIGEKNPFYGKHHTKEHNIFMSKINGGKNHHMYGKKHNEETKKKLKLKRKGRKPSWKGGYSKKGIPTYDTYAPQIKWSEKVRRNKDPNILEVKCFKCSKWFVPNLYQINNKIKCLNDKQYGESNLYCSNECKNSCSIYGKKSETLMKEDAVRAGRLKWLELEREVQPELRQMVLERDEHKCIKCNNTNNLQCHHIYPELIEPLLSADIDNCITLCKKCHMKVHKQDGCRYGQLKLQEC